MLKLVVVGCGNSHRLAEYVSELQNDLYCFVKQYGFLVYNTKKIYSLEGNFDALKKSRIYFSSKKDTTAEYWGIIEDTNLFSYYSRWCEDMSDDFITYKTGDYNNENLKTLVNGWFYNQTYLKNSNLFDLKIKYQYLKENGEDVCFLEVSLNDSKLYPTPEKLFHNLIVKMDKFFSDVFVSAYVTNEQTDIGDVHYQTYNYNFNLINSKILDVGYILYVSRGIEKANSFEMKGDLNRYSAKLLLNGTLYVDKRPTDEFGQLNNVDDLSFDKIMIPRYRVFNWSDLWNCKFFSISVCELISVYYDIYSLNDPTVVFSFGYSPNQLDNLPMLYDMICQERYAVRELIGS